MIGSCLISRDMTARMVSELDATDFYHPKLALTFQAISSLYSQGSPVDSLTVLDELRRLSPGKDFSEPEIIAIQNSTPAVSHAPRYAQIIASRGQCPSIPGRSFGCPSQCPKKEPTRLKWPTASRDQTRTRQGWRYARAILEGDRSLSRRRTSRGRGTVGARPPLSAHSDPGFRQGQEGKSAGDLCSSPTLCRRVSTLFA